MRTLIETAVLAAAACALVYVMRQEMFEGGGEILSPASGDMGEAPGSGMIGARLVAPAHFEAFAQALSARLGPVGYC
jgi:hypothetical protein